MKTQVTIILLATILAIAPALVSVEQASGEKYMCRPTGEDEMGPFYRPGAPLRSKIGTGYLLNGQVKSAVDCSPIKAALIELWQTGPDGRYDDAHRAAIITGDKGIYQLETDYPAEYLTRPPHIHIRVSAPGFSTLVTQHYLERGSKSDNFDLVLIPAH